MDNEKLEGFMERFVSKGCREIDCELCRYCHEWAKRAVVIDETYKKECLDLYGRVEKSMETGSLWRYGPK